METSIDCSRMSHATCAEGGDLHDSGEMSVAPAAASATSPAREPGVSVLRDGEGKTVGGGVSYECVNDCVSSQGVTALLSGATISLGCLVLPPACPIFIGAGVGTMLGACEVACEDLESKP